MKFLIKYDDNYSDEFDTEGIKIVEIEKKIYEPFLSKLYTNSILVYLQAEHVRIDLESLKGEYRTYIQSIDDIDELDSNISMLVNGEHTEYDIYETYSILLAYLYEKTNGELPIFKKQITYFFGSNEEMYYESYADLLSNLTITKINDAEFETFKKFNIGYPYAFGIMP